MDLVAPVIDINKFIFRLMLIDSAHFDSVLTATQAAWQTHEKYGARKKVGSVARTSNMLAKRLMNANFKPKKRPYYIPINFVPFDCFIILLFRSALHF